MKQQASTIRRRRKRRWLQLLASASSNLTATIYTTAHNYQHEQQQQRQVEERKHHRVITTTTTTTRSTGRKMAAISTLCASVIVCISLSTIMSHAAPGTLDLVSKLARGGSPSPGPYSSSSPSSASHLVKSARLATYSLSCPPEASIHPCTCIYHTPGAGIESEDEEEEIYELSAAITTPYAEPLVQTTTPAAAISLSTTVTVPSSTTTTPRPVVAPSSFSDVVSTDTPDRRTKTDPPHHIGNSLPSAPTTTISSTTTTTTTTEAPTQSTSTQPNEHQDARIGNAHDQEPAVPSVVVVTSSTHETLATSMTPPDQQASTTTTRVPALRATTTMTMTTPLDGTANTSTTTKVTAHSGGGAGEQDNYKESIAEGTTTTRTTVRPQQSEATTTSVPLTSGHEQAEPVTPVAMHTNSSGSSNASVESARGQESRNGAIASSSSASVSLNNSSSVDQASTAGAVGQREQQQEAVASEKSPSQNPADQKIPAQQSPDSLAPLQPPPPPPPQLEPYQPPLVQPAPPGSIAESPVAGERTPEQVSSGNHMTNVNQTGKQTNLELDTTATSVRVISPPAAAASAATVQALGQAQPLVAETTEIPLRLTPSSTATIWTETPLRLTSGGGPFVMVSETVRPTTTPMPLQTTSASVAPSQAATTTTRPVAEISVASFNLTVPAATTTTTTTEKPSSVGSGDLGGSSKVTAVAALGNQFARASNESGRATVAAAALTAPGLGLSGARNDKQEVVTSARPALVSVHAPYVNTHVASVQIENNGNGTPEASPISSSAAAALNETGHDYNVVSVATVAGVESTNSTQQHPVKAPTRVISSSSQGGVGLATIHKVSLQIQSGERLDLGSARANGASTLRPVTLDTLAAASTSTTTDARTTIAPSSPVSVTNQLPSTSAPAIVISQGSRQQSNASESSAAAPIAAVQLAQVQSMKPQYRPVPNSSTGSNSSASQSHGQPPTGTANNSQPGAAAAVDQTNPTLPSPTHTAHRLANNSTTHRAGPPSGNSSAPRVAGERPASAGRAIHHKPLIMGGSGNNNNNNINNNISTTSQQNNLAAAAHQSQAKPATHSNNNHQSLPVTAQNGRQILTPNTHRPKLHANRPTAAGNHHHQHINSSSHQSNHAAANNLGGRESPPAAGSASSSSSSSSFSPGPPLRRSTRSAGGPSGAARPLHAQTNRTGGNRSPPPPPPPKPHQRLTPNTLAAQAARKPNVVVTSTPNANPNFTNSSSNNSQRAPGGRRLTRFLSHDHHSGNQLSAQDPFADANEQKVEVVAYCRNIQNMQVLRSAIKGFRGHQVNYFVIDSCKVPPFPNDLFHGIDVRWLEMSNSTVQFHNNFLHGAHHNQQGQLA